MAMIRIKKINKHIVTPINVPKVEPEMIKGYDLIPKLYCTIFICAKKESGKTNAIFKILKECTGKKTNVFIISSTVYNDDNYIYITDYFEKKNINISTHTSIQDANLDELINVLEENARKELEDKKKSHEEEKPKLLLNFNEPEVKKKERKEKKVAPEYIFVFDDMSTMLRDKSISALIKKHRHFKCKIICSSQYVNDLAPEARKNIDFWILFGGHSENKLDEIYNNCDLQISFPLFNKLYENATSTPFNFLFIDRNKGQFRRNFNHEYEIEKFSKHIIYNA
jgi:hypothetical protein